MCVHWSLCIIETTIIIALMRVFPKTVVVITKSRFDVRKCIASMRGLVVWTIALEKSRKNVLLGDLGFILVQLFQFCTITSRQTIETKV